MTSPHFVSVLLGTYDLDATDESGSKRALVWDIIIHSDWDFNSEKYDADISVVVLTEMVKFSDSIQPISLPKPSNDEVSGVGTVVGWGRSEKSEGNFYDPTPSKVQIPAVNSSHCYTTFYELGLASSNRHFCGGYENQGKAPCLGDSGGGFYMQSPASSWNVRGIVSASITDVEHGCDINKFSIYTNVARFTDWIMKVMKETEKVVWKTVDFQCKQDESKM